MIQLRQKYVSKGMYSAIRRDEYPIIKPISGSEGAKVISLDSTPNNSRDPDSDEYLLTVTGNLQDE